MADFMCRGKCVGIRNYTSKAGKIGCNVTVRVPSKRLVQFGSSKQLPELLDQDVDVFFDIVNMPDGKSFYAIEEFVPVGKEK